MEARDLMQLCLKELEIVQGSIARYDQNGMTIKSWAITLWSAVIAFAIQNNNAPIALIGLIIVAGFAFNEMIYRSYQSRFIQRSLDIENALKGNLSAYQFALNAAAGRPVKFWLWRAIKQPHFWLFYLMFAALSVAVYIYLGA